MVSLVASLGVAIFLIPALSGWFLPSHRIKAIDPGKARTEKFVLGLLHHPFLVVFMTILLVGISIYGLLGLGNELMAPADPRRADHLHS